MHYQSIDEMTYLNVMTWAGSPFRQLVQDGWAPTAPHRIPFLMFMESVAVVMSATPEGRCFNGIGEQPEGDGDDEQYGYKFSNN